MQKNYIKILDLTHSKLSKQVKQIDFTKNISFGKQEEISWNGTFNNMRGLLIYPNNYKENKKYGLIVNVHGGGPSATISMYASVQIPSPLIWHLWANNHQCIIFVPEFGAIYDNNVITIEMNKKNNLLISDIQDIESGVDYLIKKDIVDKNKLIAIGGSAGSARVNLLPVISQRYKAIISVDGWIEDKDYMEQVEKLVKKDNHPIKKWGTVKNNPEIFLRQSVFEFIDRVKTPILFIVCNTKLGGIDQNDSLKQYHKMLKDRNIETEYIYLKDEGHVITKPKNIKLVLNRITKWINKFI